MTSAKKSRDSTIRVGIGGWTYAPWRDAFYPPGITQKQELAWASRQVTAIEINGTYYRTQKPESFAKWHDETPDDFVFSVKASRYATNRRILAEAGESITRFINSGIAELAMKLGPIVWQFAPTKVFDAVDFEGFLNLLPQSVGGVELRHVMDVRHASFMTPEYLALARRHRVATVFTDSDDYPSFADVTGELVYLRLMCAEPRYANGYAPKALDQWAARAQQWAQGRPPEDLFYVENRLAKAEPAIAKPAPTITKRAPAPAQAKPVAGDVFVFFINGHKPLAPAAAGALLERLR